MSDKQLVQEALNDLPEDMSLPEIMEELQTLAEIRKGQQQIAEGKCKSHEEVKSLVAAWTIK